MPIGVTAMIVCYGNDDCNGALSGEVSQPGVTVLTGPGILLERDGVWHPLAYGLGHGEPLSMLVDVAVVALLDRVLGAVQVTGNAAFLPFVIHLLGFAFELLGRAETGVAVVFFIAITLFIIAVVVIDTECRMGLATVLHQT